MKLYPLLSAAEAAGAGDFVTVWEMAHAGKKWMRRVKGQMERAPAKRNAFADTGQMGETYVSDYKSIEQ